VDVVVEQDKELPVTLFASRFAVFDAPKVSRLADSVRIEDDDTGTWRRDTEDRDT
jgi:hypothetical protein